MYSCTGSKESVYQLLVTTVEIARVAAALTDVVEYCGLVKEFSDEFSLLLRVHVSDRTNKQVEISIVRKSCDSTVRIRLAFLNAVEHTRSDDLQTFCWLGSNLTCHTYVMVSLIA